MKNAAFMAAILAAASAAAGPAFLDTSRSFEERAADLVSRMTLQEKIGQLGRTTKAVPRLGMARYDFWNEALHGIQNGTGEGTSFPMPLSLASTWDEKLIRRVAEAIADECRGHAQPLEEGGRGRGLSYWCPTVNLARHPLWGRTNEAWGEDAYVAGMLASAFVEGMKGADPRYLKTVPTIKHYALNNHENGRGSTSSDASEADIRDYYARVYRYIVERTDVPSLMSAYNAVNYTPSSGNPFLLTTLLRDTFGFTGFVVSDCGAIDNLERQQRWVPARNTVQERNYAIRPGVKLSRYAGPDGVVTKPGSVALALMAGCDMDCNGDIYPKYAGQAVDDGLLTEKQIEINVYNSVLARFKTGEFDPRGKVPWRGEKYSFRNTVETPEHRALADEAAARSAVLLKNDGALLPLDAAKIKTIAVAGDMADSCFLGNYHGKPKEKNRISCLAGIDDWLFARNRAAKTLYFPKADFAAYTEEERDAIAAADAVVVVAADEHDDSSEGKDRPALRLSRGQDELASRISKLNRNTIVFLQTSNMVEIDKFRDSARAILWSSQNGQGQGVGLARQIFGDVNPCGKLVFTWYASESDIPGIRQYGLKEKFLADEKPYPAGGYTYQYFKGRVEYPFGYGLSYTSFEYSNASASAKAVDANGKVALSVDVKNVGKREGSEIVQAYVAYPAGRGLPAKQIKGFAKVDLKPGETKRARIVVDVADCSFWKGDRRVVPEGDWTLEIAASAEDVKARFPLRVSGALAETIETVSAHPSSVSVAKGGSVFPNVRFALKDDRIFEASAAKVSYSSSDESVASVCAMGVVTGEKPGVATITAKVDWKGSVKSVSFPVAVVDGAPDRTDVSKEVAALAEPRRPAPEEKRALRGRDELEEAIRVKVSGDDYDPDTYAAYKAGVRKARETFFDPAATPEAIDAACRELLAVKANLRDFRHLVADFGSAAKTWHFNQGKSIWVNWSRNRDAAGRETESDFAAHDPAKLVLRFKIDLEPSDRRIPFAKALAGGSWIKLRSRDVAQKDDDPDLQVFGGSLSENNEHNYGWNAADWIKDWGVSEVSLPLASPDAEGRMALPVVDKGRKPSGPRNTSRGKIDWTKIDRVFMNFNFTDEFKRGCSATARVIDCRVVDTTLEEEREKAEALLREKVEGGCGCPGKVAKFEDAAIAVRRAARGESVLAIRKAAKAYEEARENVGYTVSADKDALKKAVAGRRRNFRKYTEESSGAYKALFVAAAKVLRDESAGQLEIDRAEKSLAGAEGALKLRRVEPYALGKALDGEKSVEEHGLKIGGACDIDLAGHEEYDLALRYEIKLECTHPNPADASKWLKYVVNGRTRVWGEGPQNDESAVVLASMNCAKDSPMTAYGRPGEWMQISHRIPVSKLEGAKIKRFEILMFNDSSGYSPAKADGNRWNNDTGVRMSVRNVEVSTDKPADL